MELPESRVEFTKDHPVNGLRRRYGRGDIARLRRGAYVPVGGEAGSERLLFDRCVAVARSLTVRFAFSHETAAFLHGLPGPFGRPDRVHVVQQSRPPKIKATDVVRHVVTHLPDSDVSEVAGLPVTSVERTCLDCARSQHPARALMTVDAILRRSSGTNRFTWPESRDREFEIRSAWLARLTEFGRTRGAAQARAVLAYADGRAESPPESHLRWLALVHGYDVPGLQTPVTTPGGTFYPDLLWTGGSVLSEWDHIALEYDGEDKYRAPKDLYREKAREDHLRARSCGVVRVNKSDLRHPGRLLETLHRHVRQDTASLGDRRGLLAGRAGSHANKSS